MHAESDLRGQPERRRIHIGKSVFQGSEIPPSVFEGSAAPEEKFNPYYTKEVVNLHFLLL